MSLECVRKARKVSEAEGGGVEAELAVRATWEMQAGGEE